MLFSCLLSVIQSEDVLCHFVPTLKRYCAFFGYYVPTLKRKDRINTMLNALNIPCLENSRPVKCLSEHPILSDRCSSMLVIAWGPAWLSLLATLIHIIQLKLMSIWLGMALWLCCHNVRLYVNVSRLCCFWPKKFTTMLCG